MGDGVRERLLNLCDVSDHCWMWRGSIGNRGYGRIKIDGKWKRAHRVSYEIFKGPIGSDLFVCHHCDEPGCINPDHLYAGTHEQNMKDMVDRRRHNAMRPFARSFDNNPRAKLSLSDLPDIRAKIADGIPDTHIAREYGVGRKAIGDIRIGKTWRYP